jgi:hypothetical protein
MTGPAPGGQLCLLVAHCVGPISDHISIVCQHPRLTIILQLAAALKRSANDVIGLVDAELKRSARNRR